MSDSRLAYVGRIIEIEPIEKADMLVSATVVCGDGGKWVGVVPVGTVVGSKVVAFLQDAVLPHSERWAFMAKDKWVVRMRRFRGAPSECLIIDWPEITEEYEVGEDLTELIGVTKFTKPIPAQLGGKVTGGFPSYIPKTDELNFQSVPGMVNFLRNSNVGYYATVKYDGTSCTAYRSSEHFGVCSRNYELDRTTFSAYWQVVEQLGIEDKLPYGYAVQLEVYGEGIQNNPLGIKGVGGAVFNVYNFLEHRFLDFEDAYNFCKERQIPFVDFVVVSTGKFDYTDEQLRQLANGKYANGKIREGIVIRPLTELKYKNARVSFKVINLEYK